MELCTNKSLQDLVDQRALQAFQNGAKEGYQGLSDVEVRYFMSQIVDTIQYLHSDEIRVIHRDLSLKNIFIGNNEENQV
jgi:serine/threonine protein kinase